MRARAAAVVCALAVSCGLLVAGPAPATAADVRFIAAYASFADVPTDDALSGLGLSVVYRLQAVPAVALSGNVDAVGPLRATTPVVGIEFDRELDYFMDTAVLATRAADVWGDAWNWPVAGDVHQDGRTPLEVDGKVIDGDGVTVGVVDTGVNALHPDLWYADLHTPELPWEPKTLACVHTFGSFSPSQPYCDETVGHGTHVAGTVAGTAAAVRNGLVQGLNGRPFMGAAPGAKIVSAGLGAGIFVIDTLGALDWMWANAERYGIRVVNNSWGGTGECGQKFVHEMSQFDTFTRIIDALVDKDIVVVFAAGNYEETETWTNPQSSVTTPGVISVANYDDRNQGLRHNRISDASSDGCVSAPGSQGDLVWTWPDVSAPGTDIMSTNSYTGLVVTALGAFGPRRHPFYAQVSGTSMAAPHVAGIAALMLQANPDLTPAEVERILIETATPWDDTVASREIEGSVPHWGAVNTGSRIFVDPDACRITPAHAADPDGAKATFPRFHELPDPELYVCRDYRRGRGLVDAYAAVQAALALRSP